MIVNDPIADMITRIRNGLQARKATVKTPSSKLRKQVLDVLVREGFITSYKSFVSNKFEEIEITLKYFEGEPSLKTIRKVSKPGRRIYSQIKSLQPIHNGLGISILSTSQGVLSDVEAFERNIGGEVLCSVF